MKPIHRPVQCRQTAPIDSPAKLSGIFAAVFLGLAGSACTLPSYAASIDETRPFDIKPQSLQSALDALGEQSQLQLFYSADLVKDLDTQGVSGRLSTAEALSRLLKDSGLYYKTVDDKTITLVKPRTEFSVESLLADAGEFVLAKPEPEENPWTGPVEQLDMKVLGGALDGYAVVNASTATKTDTPIMETPVSIQVVPQQVLKDQQAISVQDAVKNVSGIVPQFTFGYREGFLIRGFVTRDFERRDGFLTRGTRKPLANVDRVEVLKGPAAILYGNMEPGGLINLATKRPQAESYYAFSQQFGSFDTYRTLLDATGPITSDGALSYRLNFEYLGQNSFRDFVSIDRKMVAPSFTWRNAHTQVDVDFLYQGENNVTPLLAALIKTAISAPSILPANSLPGDWTILC